MVGYILPAAKPLLLLSLLLLLPLLLPTVLPRWLTSEALKSASYNDLSPKKKKSSVHA